MIKIYSPKNIITLLICVLFTAVIFSGCKKNDEAGVVTTDQYIKYTINNVAYNYEVPVDTFYNAATYSLMAMAIFGENLITPVNNVAMVMAYPGMGVGSNQNLLDFSPSQVNGHLSVTNPIFVHITEFGAIGQYMAGEFTGILTGPPPANIQYNITCTYRVKR